MLYTHIYMTENPICFRLSREEKDKLNLLSGGKSFSVYCKEVIIEHINANVATPPPEPKKKKWKLF